MYTGIRKSDFALNGVDNLVDFKDRTIKFPKWDDEVKRIYLKLLSFIEQKSRERINGVCITRYNGSQVEIKIGIRYNDEGELVKFSEEIDGILNNVESLIEDPGFGNTQGINFDPPLPPRIVVDYIKCKSFEWFVRLKGNISQLERNKIDIEKDVIHSKYIFRNVKDEKPLNDYEIAVVWERFIHLFVNLCPPIAEIGLNECLWRSGIPILL